MAIAGQCPNLGVNPQQSTYDQVVLDDIVFDFACIQINLKLMSESQ
jgi:hypothetical protein